MDEILTYKYFKEQYPQSKITESDYNIYYKFSKDYILNKIAYSYDSLEDKHKKDIEFYVLFQVNYFAENGLEKDGLVSQSINGVSASFNTDNKQGDFNISGIVKNWLKNSCLTMRRL